MMAVAQKEALNFGAFQTLGIRDGLRSNSVTSLLSDSRGYLWIGTMQGLNRYDGHEVKTRFPESRDARLQEVMNGSVTTIEEDAEERIWIQCASGEYFLYDTRTAQFSAGARELLSSVGIKCNGKYKVKVSRKGVWWVVTENIIWRYNTLNKELKHWQVRVPVPGTSANLMAEMSDGLYVSSNHAVWHMDSSTGDVVRETLPTAMEDSLAEIGLLADNDGTLWTYSTRQERICRYVLGGRSVKEMAPLPLAPGASQNNAIRDMLDDGRGRIWIATDHRGLFAYDKRTGTITAMRHQREELLSLASDNATCLEVDGEGTIWVGHLKTGLSYTSETNSVVQSHARRCGDILSMDYDI